MEIRKVGVEEELLLVDPRTRLAVPRSQQVVREDLDQELFLHQVETNTDATTDLAELAAQVRAARRTAGEAASAHGLAVVACGAEPLRGPSSRVTPDDRYEDLLERFGDVARAAGTCGMHVHVDVADEDEGVAVIDRLGLWLPLLLALSAGSPFYEGHDTGYASWRAQVWSRWPTSGPTGTFGTPDRYHELVGQLIATGAARDEHNVYFDARLSRELPTIELRVADVCTEVDDAVLVAAVARALVDTAARWAREGVDVPEPRFELKRAAAWRASRHGLSDELVHPFDLRPRPASEVMAVLLEAVADSLEQAGDLDLVTRRLLESPPRGAEVQREVHARTGSVEHVVDDLVARTAATWLV
jgi:carboxylate-amine ligase